MADPTMVMNFEKDPNIGIHKKVLHAGKGDVPNYQDNTKVRRNLSPFGTFQFTLSLLVLQELFKKGFLTISYVYHSD